MLLQRIIWGIISGALLLVLIKLGGIAYTLAIGLLVTLATLEYAELLKKQSFRPQTGLILSISLLLLVLIHVTANSNGLVNGEAIRISERLIGLFLVVVFIISLFSELLRGDPDQGLVNVAVNLFGAVYIGIMFAYTLLLRFVEAGFYYVLFMVLVTWANDSAAYFVGVNLGKHKLSPRISPKKTVEGSLGGLVGGLIIAVVLAISFQKSILTAVILGMLVVVAGQFGDLIESIIKRNAGVKDSGKFLPGHGGVLDRFDSLLLSAPLVYYTATYILPYL